MGNKEARLLVRPSFLFDKDFGFGGQEKRVIHIVDESVNILLIKSGKKLLDKRR